MCKNTVNFPSIEDINTIIEESSNSEFSNSTLLWVEIENSELDDSNDLI